MKYNIKTGSIVTLVPMSSNYMDNVLFYCSNCFKINCLSIGTVLSKEYKFVQNTENDLSLFMRCESPYNGHYKLTSSEFIDKVIAI